MVTRLYTHDIFEQHITPPGHPERVDRLRALKELFAGDDFGALKRFDAPRGDESLTELAHPEAFRERILAQVPETGMAQIDGDTIVSPMSYEAALHALGAATDAVDAVMTGACDNAFVAARPPGHHAEKDTAMGFCLFNSVAIAARHAQKAHGAERVAIVDFDVHHGNGTQDIFWADDSVLFCSTHQMPLFPGSGAKDETGAHGTICNAPLSPGDGRDAFREAFKSRVITALKDFQPDLLMISAGFDAHRRDPLAEINLDGDDFDWATAQLMDIADRFCGNRIASLLEGGYDLQGLAEGAGAHVTRLMRG